VKIVRIIFQLFRFITFSAFTYCIAPSVYAISIGDADVQTPLGAPLFAQVALQLRDGEHIDNACLSLSTTEDSAGFIPADLTASLNPSKQKIIIKSHKEFNEVFAVFRLQIKCAGIGSVSKIITLLPEIGVYPPASTTTPGNISDVSTLPLVQKIATQESSIAQRDLHSPLKADQTKLESHIASPTRHLSEDSRRKIIPNNIPERQFSLKLSGATLNLSRVGKMSASDRELLLAEQRMQDNNDDQTAKLLSMQHQLQLMQEELSTVKLKLAEIKENSTAGVTPTLAPTPPYTQENIASNRILWLIAFLLIPLAWLVLRYFKRSAPPQRRSLSPSIESLPQSIDNFVMPARFDTINMASEHLLSQTNTTDEVPKETSAIIEEDKDSLALLEEAELYAVYGHTFNALAILEEFVIQHPNCAKGWLLLLSIYSSQGQSDEFEKAARHFSVINENDPAWAMMQALGLTLDPTNPLYSNKSNPIILDTQLSKGHERRPIGLILVDLGYLTQQDLERILESFDPDKHGRFGKHLVSRRQVSYAQLNEAVLAQQEHTMMPQPDVTLQQLQFSG
jgi:tetratricopeptide (TPR) repeat protein